MKKILLLLILSAAFVLTANAQTQNFAGRYEFFEDGGKTAGGTAVFVGHSLEIKPDGTARLSADGFQTARDLICTAKISGSKLMIYFSLYDDEGVNSLTDYDADDLLLTLETKTIRGKKVLWTTWGKYQPAIIAAKKNGGIFFKKSN